IQPNPDYKDTHEVTSSNEVGDVGRLALIVGVGPGIGAALARRFAQAGMGVALATRKINKLDGLVAECRSLGRRAIPYGCDASDEMSVRKMFQLVSSDI